MQGRRRRRRRCRCRRRRRRSKPTEAILSFQNRNGIAMVTKNVSALIFFSNCIKTES